MPDELVFGPGIPLWGLSPPPSCLSGEGGPLAGCGGSRAAGGWAGWGGAMLAGGPRVLLTRLILSSSMAMSFSGKLPTILYIFSPT